MAYPHKWSPISYKSSAGQRKDTGQRPMLYRWTTHKMDIAAKLQKTGTYTCTGYILYCMSVFVHWQSANCFL